MGVCKESIDFDTPYYSAVGYYVVTDDTAEVFVKLKRPRGGKPLTEEDTQDAMDCIITQIEEEHGIYLKESEIEWDIS